MGHFLLDGIYTYLGLWLGLLFRLANMGVTMEKADLELTDEEIWKASGLEGTYHVGFDGGRAKDIANAATDKALRGVAEWLREDGFRICCDGMCREIAADNIEETLTKEKE